jgi:hypothetical protein
MNDTNVKQENNTISKVKDYAYLILAVITISSMIFTVGGFYWRTESQDQSIRELILEVKILKEQNYFLNERILKSFSNIEIQMAVMQRDIDYLKQNR